MRRHILFLKSVQVANVLLATGKCKNESEWVLTCEDNNKSMEVLQKAITKFFKGTVYKNYKLCFAEPDNYGRFIIIWFLICFIKLVLIKERIAF